MVNPFGRIAGAWLVLALVVLPGWAWAAELNSEGTAPKDPVSEDMAPGVLSLSEALDAGTRNWLQANEVTEGARFHRLRERERWRRRYLPSLTLSGTSQKDNLSDEESEEEVEARMDYLVYAGGRHRASHLAAQSAGRAEAMDRREALAALHLQIADRFFELLSSQRRLASLDVSVERAERDHQNMVRRRELGLRTELEVLQALLLLEDERFNHQAERRTRDELAQHLSHLVRVKIPPEIELRPNLLPEDSSRSLATYRKAAQERHWGLIRLEWMMEEAHQELKAQQGAGLPEVALSTVVTDPEGESFTTAVSLSLTYRFGGHSTRLEQGELRGKKEGTSFVLQGGEVTNTSPVSEESTSTTRWGLTLFDFADTAFEQSSREAGARIEYARAARSLIEAREARTREVTQRYNVLERTRAKLALERLRVRKNSKELAAYEASYKAGSVPYEDVVERRTALTTGQLAEITARGEVLQARAALLNASALPLIGEKE